MESPATQRTWTTARCNRLLRPLSSKLALLRKELPPNTAEEGGAKAEVEFSISSCEFPVQVTSTTGAVREASANTFSRCQNLELSPRPRKRIKRTYSCREVGVNSSNGAVKSRYKQSNTEPSIRFPNPRLVIDQQSRIKELLNEIHIPLNHSNHISSTMKGPKHNAKRQYAKLAYPDRWKLIEGIYNGLDALLKATAGVAKTQPTGSRTLFSTCLRRTPDYIAAEEIWSKEEDPESTADISSTIYNDLEALGVSSTGGWRPLREIVRAHGIALLGAAVKDRVIISGVARSLVKLCIAHSAFDEGQQLIECMIGTMRPLEPPSSIRSSLLVTSDLAVLDYFARISGRYGFQYRELTNLFRSGILPIEWMSTLDMIPCWNRLIGSLAEKKDQVRGAATLLRTVLSLSYGVSYSSLSSQIHNVRLCAGGLPRATRGEPLCGSKTSKVSHPAKEDWDSKSQDMTIALHSTSSHLLAILTTLDLLQTSAFALSLEQSDSDNPSVLQDIAFETHQALEAEQRDENPGEILRLYSYRRQMCLPLLAASVVIAAKDQDTVELNQDICRHFDLIRYLKPGDDFADTAASFICAIVNCCGQAESSEAFDYTQRIIKGLTQSSICQSLEPETRRLFQKIAVTAAVQFSKSTSLPKHLSWALELESFFNGQTPIRPSAQCLTRAKKGFRWEEGICEWVAGTPVIPMPKPISYKQQDSSAPSLSGDIVAAIAHAPSTSHPLQRLLEVSPCSIKFNSAATPPSESLEKFSSGFFCRVEIDNSDQGETWKGHDCTTAKVNSDSIHPWKTTAQKKLEIHVGKPTTSDNPRLSNSSPRVERTITRGWKRRHMAGKRKASWVSNQSPDKAPHLDNVESEVKAVESEDELGFS
ncbi:hypothetical protein MMC07_007196 [Pseudocyphellaria aurata]|nr:hypothetical protein [Pseudocyphellaria aurata]